MSSRISEFVFSEPSGRLNAAVMFSGSIVFASLYAYFGVLGDSTSISSIFLSIGFALSGIAESLPKDRRRTAGVFRVSAMLVLTSLLALVALAPELVVGER